MRKKKTNYGIAFLPFAYFLGKIEMYLLSQILQGRLLERENIRIFFFFNFFLGEKVVFENGKKVPVEETQRALCWLEIIKGQIFGIRLQTIINYFRQYWSFDQMTFSNSFPNEIINNKCAFGVYFFFFQLNKNK